MSNFWREALLPDLAPPPWYSVSDAALGNDRSSGVGRGEVGPLGRATRLGEWRQERSRTRRMGAALQYK